MLQVCFDCYGSYTTDSVYQWDLNRRLAIRGLDYASAPAIHFSNKKSTEALVVQSTIEDGVIYCDVPNILLQEPYDIVGYVCECLDQELTTYETIRIPVKPRVKPADYAYSDNVEILTYYSLMSEITSVKASTEKDLNSMDASKASKAELSAVKSEVDTDIARVENEIASERSRIDQLVTSPEMGEGDFEKEVEDLRIDTKGTTHGSAGTAVRAQIQELDAKIDDEVSTLSSEIGDVKDITYIDRPIITIQKNFVQGKLTGDALTSYDGTDTTRISMCNTFKASKEIALSIAENYKCMMISYSGEYGAYINTSAWLTKSVTIPKDTYYRLMLAKVDNGAILPSEAEIALKAITLLNDVVEKPWKSLALPSLWEVGSYDTNNGTHLENVQRVRTSIAFKLKKGDVIDGNGHEIICLHYNSTNIADFNKTFGEGWENKHEMMFDSFVRIVIKSELDVTEEIKESLINDICIYGVDSKTVSEMIFDKINNINVETSKIVNMGTPYMYLSDFIDDEILDNTTVDDVYAIYDNLCAEYPETIKRLDDIGVDESGLPMRLYRIKWQYPWISGSGQESLWNNNLYNSSYDYQKIFVNAGTHGNEKSSTLGVALAFKDIVESNEDWARYIRGNFIIDICPIANPWGYNNTSRNGYGDVNINRDFLARTRKESIALYNLVANGGYHAYIDSHNSGGNSNYFGITSTNKHLKTYVQMNMKFAHLVYNDWKQLCEGDSYAIAPYLQCWVQEPLGMFHDMMNELGIQGYLIESVGVFKEGIGQLTPNHKKYCKFTKDMLVNSIIALGSNKIE